MVKVFTKEEISELFLYLVRPARNSMSYWPLMLAIPSRTSLICNMQMSTGRRESFDEIREKVKKKAKVQRCVKLWPSTLRATEIAGDGPER